jgi:molybdopterin/thiamine biosynthesis adenylyltransferase
MKELLDHLAHFACGDLLPWEAEQTAVARFGVTWAEVEQTALEAGLLPARYQRNRATFTIEQQRTLFRSIAAVVGCGGLGGYIVEELARLGVGRLIVIDPDVYEAHNLNRQLHSHPGVLGRAKAEVAAERVRQINPAVTVSPLAEAYTLRDGSRQLRDAMVVADALDSIPIRLNLAQTCRTLGIPLVHGSIAGWYGQVTVQAPGEATLELIYGRVAGEKGIEASVGNPSFTPAVVASLEAAEVCKILLGIGCPLRRRLLLVDLLEMKFEEVDLTP